MIVWTPENNQKLFIATLAAHPELKLNYQKIAEMFGPDATGNGVRHRFRSIKKAAREICEGGGEPSCPPSSKLPKMPKKRKRAAAGGSASTAASGGASGGASHSTSNEKGSKAYVEHHGPAEDENESEDESRACWTTGNLHDEKSQPEAEEDYQDVGGDN